MLEELAAEGRLGKNHWRILIYLWRRHLAGEEAHTLRPLSMTELSLRSHCEHLAFRGLVTEHPDGGRFLLTPKAREAFAMPAAAPLTRPTPAVHPFLARDYESQRKALAYWFDASVGRDKLTAVHQAWQAGHLAALSVAQLDLCEKWAVKADQA